MTEETCMCGGELEEFGNGKRCTVCKMRVNVLHLKKDSPRPSRDTSLVLGSP